MPVVMTETLGTVLEPVTDSAPVKLPLTGDESDNPFAGMSLAEVLLFASTTAGAAAALGIVYSFAVQAFPQFNELSSGYKLAAVAGLAIGIPVVSTALRVAWGYVDASTELWGDAVWAGIVAFGISQVTHNIRKNLNRDDRDELALSLIVDAVAQLEQYDRDEVWQLVQQVKDLRDDGLGNAAGVLFDRVVWYWDKCANS